MAIGATYKIYNSAINPQTNEPYGWVEYYFKTSAQLVGVDSSRKFLTSDVQVNGVSFTLANDVTGAAYVTINATNIASVPVAPSGYSLNYIGAQNETIAQALGKLDKAAYDALNAIPDGVVVADEYGNVNIEGNLYFDDISGIETYDLANYGTQMAFYNTGGQYRFYGNEEKTKSGLLKFGGLSANDEKEYTFPNASGTIALQDWVSNGYVPTSRTVNGKALSSNISIISADIGYDGPDGNQQLTVKQGIDMAISIANNNAQSYAISKTNPSSGSGWANSQFDSTNDSITINSNAGSNTNMRIECLDGTEVFLYNLKVGDTIFISDTNLPDRWLGSKVQYGEEPTDCTYVFYKLETYNMQWGAIAGKPDTISGYGITDASINTTTKVITLGTSNNSPVTISPVTGIKVGSGGSELSPINGVVTLPDYPEVGGFVPYEGAEASVDLGQWGLIANYVEATDGGYNYAKMAYGSIELKNQGGVMTLNFPTIAASTTKTIATTDQLSGYIPLSGTTVNNGVTGDILPNTDESVNLGSSQKRFNEIYTGSLKGGRYLNITGTNVNLYASAGVAINSNSNGYAILESDNLTSADRTFQFPDMSGTLGLMPTVGTTAPSSPVTGAVWIDTN